MFFKKLHCNWQKETDQNQLVLRHTLRLSPHVFVICQRSKLCNIKLSIPRGGIGRLEPRPESRNALEKEIPTQCNDMRGCDKHKGGKGIFPG